MFGMLLTTGLIMPSMTNSRSGKVMSLEGMLTGRVGTYFAEPIKIKQPLSCLHSIISYEVLDCMDRSRAKPLDWVSTNFEPGGASGSLLQTEAELSIVRSKSYLEIQFNFNIQ